MIKTNSEAAEFKDWACLRLRNNQKYIFEAVGTTLVCLLHIEPFFFPVDTLAHSYRRAVFQIFDIYFAQFFNLPYFPVFVFQMYIV